MKDYRPIEELVTTHIKAYEDGFNSINQEYELKFNLTLSHHKIELKGMKKDVAYLRLERQLRPKAKEDEEQAEWESMLIYNQAYKFESVAERLDPKTSWKYPLYMDCMGKLIAGGLEYSELLRHAQIAKKNTKHLSDLIVPEDKEIIITDQMPAPLSQEDLAYKEEMDKLRS